MCVRFIKTMKKWVVLRRQTSYLLIIQLQIKKQRSGRVPPSSSLSHIEFQKEMHEASDGSRLTSLPTADGDHKFGRDLFS